MAIVNLNIKSLIKKRRSNRQKGVQQQTHKRSSRRVVKPRAVDTTPTWVDTPDLTILPQGDYMPEPTTVSTPRPAPEPAAPSQKKVVTPTRRLESEPIDYDEERKRLGDIYLAATGGFGSEFIRGPRYPKRK